MVSKLRILLIHNYYKLPGGEDTVVENEKRLLEEQGYFVCLYTRSNSEMDGFSAWRKLLLPLTAVFSLRTYREVKKLIREQQIDIVHVHNTLALISPSVYYAALRCGRPVVQTLHNYRLICPNGLLYRDGHICEECIKKGYRCAVMHACYRNSRLQTMISVLALKVHRLLGVYNRLNLICLTDFQKRKIEQRFPKARIFVKPNFTDHIDDQTCYTQNLEAAPYIYVGRMEKNKGIWVLLKAFEQLEDVPLLLVGTGPEEKKIKRYLERKSLKQVRYCGFQEKEWIMKQLKSAKALILPSQCYETFGMTVVESFSCKTPVIISDIEVLAEAVREHGAGLVFRHDSPADLCEKVLEIERNSDFARQAGICAYQAWEECYGSEGNLHRLEEIYFDASRKIKEKEKREGKDKKEERERREKKGKKEEKWKNEEKGKKEERKKREGKSEKNKKRNGRRCKRVVIITNIPSPYRVDFFDYLQRHTHIYEIHILYAAHNEENRSWEIEEDKMRNSHFPDSYTIRIPYRFDTKYIHISKGATRILKELQPAIVVGAEYNPTALQALRYCLKKGIPYISWTDGTLHSERGINWLQRRLRSYVVGHASAYIASSTKAREAQLAYGADAERCFISFLTVDLEKYMVGRTGGKKDTVLKNNAGAESVKHAGGEKQILCVGSLIERKGVDLLLEAVKGIREDFILALAGSGPEENHLRKLARELGIEDRVKFLGFLSREELKKEYAKSVVFVLPTRQDCFALVILEAMCAGLPVVCSRYADGAYDLVEDGKNGYIVDPYDKEQLCGCIRALLHDEKLAGRMGEYSQHILDRFSFAQVSKGFWDAFAYVEEK